MDGLPEHSLTVAARGSDDEAVSAYLDSLSPEERKRRGRPRPPLAGYSREAAGLDRLTAAVYGLTSLVNSALDAGMKIPEVRTPETAAERWHRRNRADRMGSLVAEVEAAQARSAAGRGSD